MIHSACTCRLTLVGTASRLSGSPKRTSTPPRALMASTTEAVRDPQIRAALAQGFREIDAALEARIRFAQRQGEFSRAADPFALAMLASATLHTLALRARAGATRDALQAIVAAALDVICGFQPTKRR